MKNLFVICFGLFIAGCSATGPAFIAVAPNETEGVIYVYRPPRLANAGGAPKITLDGQERGRLSNGGYLALRVPVGEHVVEQKYSIWDWDMRAPPVKLMVQPGKSYFARLLTDATAGNVTSSAATTSFTITRWISFQAVDDATGLAEIRGLNLSE